MKNGSYPWNAIVAEAVGTFLFLTVGIGASAVVSQSFPGGPAGDLVSVALAHGIALAVMVTAFAAVSGGHFNPAITFALWLTGKSETSRSIAYILAQLIAAVAAALLVRSVTPAVVPATAVLPSVNPAIDGLQAGVLEAALTMVLAVAVFGTAVDPRAAKLGGLLIGIAITAAIMFGGPLTGAGMNPARWFGPAVVAGDYTNAAIYILGPLTGATIIAIIYRYLFLPEANAQTGATV